MSGGVVAMLLNHRLQDVKPQASVQGNNLTWCKKSFGLGDVNILGCVNVLVVNDE